MRLPPHPRLYCQPRIAVPWPLPLARLIRTTGFRFWPRCLLFSLQGPADLPCPSVHVLVLVLYDTTLMSTWAVSGIPAVLNRCDGPGHHDLLDGPPLLIF